MDVLETIPGAVPIPTDPALSEAWITLLALLDRFSGTAAINFQTAPSLPPDPDPLVSAIRWLALLLGAAAAGLGAAAAGRLGGLTAAWIAGGLIAVSPLALDQVGVGSIAALHTFVGAGLIYALTRFKEQPGLGRGVPLGAWGGAALATGGGGIGLLAGVAMAGGASAGIWITAAVTAWLLAPGLLPGFPTLPEGAAPLGSNPVLSPLAHALSLLTGALGPLGVGLASVGGLMAAFRGNSATRSLLVATLGALLVSLVRRGPDSAALTAALPGFAVLAGWAVSTLLVRMTGAWVGAVAAAIVLAVPSVDAFRTVVAYSADGSITQAENWIRTNVPDGSALIIEDPRIVLPSYSGVAEANALRESGTISQKRLEKYTRGGRIFQAVPLPPRTSNALEGALFYDPNLAMRFPYLILSELPDVDVVSDRMPVELLTARRLFQDYFREVWTETARFQSKRQSEPEITVLERPEGWEIDLDALGKLGFVLLRDPLLTLRERSSALTDWALESGQSLLAAGDLVGARAYLGMVTERDSTRVEGHFQFARTLFLLGEFDRAKSELLLGMNVDPYHGGIHLQMGALLEAEGDIAGAGVEYAAAVSYLDDPSFAMAQLGGLLFRIGDSAGARAQLEALERDHPDSDATRALRKALSTP